MEFTRQEINQFLAKTDAAGDDQGTLEHLLLKGFEGYENMSDEAIQHQLEYMDMNEQWELLPGGGINVKENSDMAILIADTLT